MDTIEGVARGPCREVVPDFVPLVWDVVGKPGNIRGLSNTAEVVAWQSLPHTLLLGLSLRIHLGRQSMG